METALGLLGYMVTSVYGRDLSFDTLQKEFVSRGLAIAETVDAVQDMPWPLLYRELDEAFPDAKFILTVRNEDAWWASILGHFGRSSDVMQQLVYGADSGAPLGNERRYRRVYRNHNTKVRDYFAGRSGKLLEIDFSGPVSWGPLCDFVGKPVPCQLFPKSNQPRQVPTLKRKLRRIALKLMNSVIPSRTA